MERMSHSAAECERCGATGATKRVRYDPWGRIFSQDYWCDTCEDSWEPPEPDMMEPNETERMEMVYLEKRKTEGSWNS